VRFSDQLNVAVATMLTAAAIFVSTFAGPSAGRWTAAVLLATSAAFFLWLAIQGPREVDVRFGDSDSLVFWRKMHIRRAINSFYVYLRDVGLDDLPRTSPIINLNTREGRITGCDCQRPDSRLPDRSNLNPNLAYSRREIALAYSTCYFHRLAGCKGKNADDFHDSGSFVVMDYFCCVFGRRRFIQNPKNYEMQLLAALLSIRLDCGATFTDGAMVHVAKLMPLSPKQSDDSFGVWFYRLFQQGMYSIGQPGEFARRDRANDILVERGL
jgi:hypothetical protein